MNKLIEILADIEHKKWSNWQSHLHSLCVKNEDGSLTIPKEIVEHFNYEINTNYNNLPNHIQEYDREEVKKILNGIRQYWEENNFKMDKSVLG